jgi:hypothetical protein
LVSSPDAENHPDHAVSDNAGHRHGGFPPQVGISFVKFDEKARIAEEHGVFVRDSLRI